MFSMYDTILYDNTYLKDLSQKFSAKDVDDPRFLYDSYYIGDKERPDVVSTKFYGVPYYHWVILVTNNMTLKTWPKSEKTFMKYIEGKYGSLANANRLADYVDENGVHRSYVFPETIVTPNGNFNYHFDGGGFGLVEGDNVYALGFVNKKTFYDVEYEKNESLKNIRILNPEFIPDVVKLAKTLL